MQPAVQRLGINSVLLVFREGSEEGNNSGKLQSSWDCSAEGPVRAGAKRTTKKYRRRSAMSSRVATRVPSANTRAAASGPRW